ncbi:MAG: carbohydrate kinase family protein [Verrucomicrobiales bacterium]
MNDSRQGILLAGNWIIDRVKLIDVYPEQDTLATISAESQSNGGGPFNVSKDLSKLFGEKPPFPLFAAGLIGTDPDGEMILADCAEHGIDTSFLQVSEDAPTSYTDVMTVESTGRRTFFHQRGANALFDGSRLDFEASKARFFYLGYLLLLDAMDELQADGETRATQVLRRASESGHRTVVDIVSEDSDRFRRLVTPALPQIDVLFLNEFEASRVTGQELRPDSSREAFEQAARQILEMGVREMVVIHAESGALAGTSQGEAVWQGSVRVHESEIRGAVGAGDAFAAGFLLGLHRGDPVDVCLKLGVTVAASCLLHPTTSGGILPLEKCRALGDEWGFR